jgi:hypothetical protein
MGFFSNGTEGQFYQEKYCFAGADGTKRGRAERRTIVRETSEGQEMLFGHLSSLRDNTDWRW